MKTIGVKTMPPGLSNKIEQLHAWPLDELKQMERHASKQQAKHANNADRRLFDLWCRRSMRLRAEIERRFDVVDAVDDFCREASLVSI